MVVSLFPFDFKHYKTAHKILIFKHCKMMQLKGEVQEWGRGCPQKRIISAGRRKTTIHIEAE